MTKRTAMLMAAGVVLALLGGSVALSFSLAGNQTAEAGPREASKPIVRTIHRTIRVEKQAKGSAPVKVVTLQAPTSLSDQPSSSDAVSSDDSYQDDDSYEHEDDADEHDDDAYEHDDDAYEHQSGSTEDHSSDDSGSVEEHEDD
jgi:hypothetical protein